MIVNKGVSAPPPSLTSASLALSPNKKHTPVTVCITSAISKLLHILSFPSHEEAADKQVDLLIKPQTPQPTTQPV